MSARATTGRRPRPHDRLEDVISAASDVFARRGYRRTQVADVAAELGVSAGNIYNYVEGKDALFHLVLRRLFGERPGGQAPALPVRGSTVAVTAEWLSRRLDFVSDYPVLERALAQQRAGDQDEELCAIAGELYDVLARMRPGIEILRRSVDDVPELAEVFAALRVALFARYERYLRLRQAAGAVDVADPRAAAHAIVELCWWGAGRRVSDPHAAGIDDDAARRTVCDFVSSALRTVPTRGQGRTERAR